LQKKHIVICLLENHSSVPAEKSLVYLENNHVGKHSKHNILRFSCRFAWTVWCCSINL